MIALLIRYWYVAVIAALCAALGVQEMRINHAQTRYAQLEAEFAEAKAAAAKQAQDAERAAREEEERREQRKEEILDEAEKRTALALAAARNADAAAVSLRARLAAVVAAARSGPANPDTAKPSEGKPDSAALDLLAGMFSRVDDATGELAAYSDKLRIAGLACEREYDSLTQ